jgi:hypothetical protein
MVCETCSGWGAIKRPRRLFVDHNDEKYNFQLALIYAQIASNALN